MRKLHAENVSQNIVQYLIMLSSKLQAKVSLLFQSICPPFPADEPCTASRGGYTDRHPGLVAQVDELLAHGFTPVAVDIKTQKIIGAALSHVYSRYRFALKEIERL